MNDTTLVVKRTFEATRERVFEAWTDPLQLAEWIGPGTVKVDVHDLDATEGGTYSLTMVSPKGEHPLTGVFKTIDPPKKLVMTWKWGETETVKDWTNETLITVEFEEVEGKTEMTFTHEDLFDESAKVEHGKGWAGSFDKLDKYLNER